SLSSPGKNKTIVDKCFMAAAKQQPSDNTPRPVCDPTSSVRAASLTSSCETPDCDLPEGEDPAA
ncbi:Hypothetical predicted protein, partial [Marmota monax]